jgi:hypothetical protein
MPVSSSRVRPSRHRPGERAIEAWAVLHHHDPAVPQHQSPHVTRMVHEAWPQVLTSQLRAYRSVSLSPLHRGIHPPVWRHGRGARVASEPSAEHPIPRREAGSRIGRRCFTPTASSIEGQDTSPSVSILGGAPCDSADPSHAPTLSDLRRTWKPSPPRPAILQSADQ